MKAGGGGGGEVNIDCKHARGLRGQCGTGSRRYRYMRTLYLVAEVGGLSMGLVLKL